ncbi:cytochrome b-c1 complex subunit 7 [Pelagophyceae sp. CCMP2097]|nr:cytochrome b-c1 complex subunit 7 [Pelagophyceae sp. CCMP2097]
MALARFATKWWNGFCKNYQAQVAMELNQYGLRYDDIKIETDDVKLALDRLPQEERLMRARRFKRAFDLSFKKKVLTPELQAIQTPLKPYLTLLADQAKERRLERELLNTFN